jgi:alkylation response protein AidB-like acyl-CoA dehydrogenase
MADGAARLLSLHVTGTTGGDRDTQKAAVLRAALARLTSRDPAHAWTSGQWMTERSGGSDVRGTETVARRLDRDSDGALDAHGLPLGPWSVDGFKWFSSATDCNMTILLAQTPGGLSTFYAPMRRQASSSAAIASPDGSELNGVTIQRLKPKLGTRALPTAELELKNLRAYLLGVEGQGVREISAILNITRIHTALSALGMWGRGLAISRAFSRVRRVAGGTLLTNVPAHVRTIARETVDYAAMMHLGYVTVTALGCVEQNGHIWPFNSTQEAGILLRLLTPVAKAMCSKRAISGLQECMESLGGIGYLEDEQMFNVARLFRDVNVLSIWEGTTEVMAEDVIRVITGRQGQEVRKALDVWVRRHVSSWGSSWAVGEECVKAELAVLEECWTNMSAQELVYNGRKGLDRLAFVVAAVMMVEDARRDASVTATAIARRWIYSREADISGKEKPWKEDAEMDRLIAFQLEADSNHGPAKL